MRPAFVKVGKPVKSALHSRPWKIACVLLAAVLIASCALLSLNDVRANPSGFEPASVVRVVDGDTLIIDRGRGDERLRLIGIDAPESVHPDAVRNTAEGKTASEHLKETLPKGSVVWLQRDVSDTDRYGRLLRYVWLEKPDDTGSFSEVSDKMLNAALVAEGYAEPKDYPPDTMYSDMLFRACPRSL